MGQRLASSVGIALLAMLCAPLCCAQAATPELRLQIRGNQTHFLLGEVIELELVFRNTTSDTYLLRSPRESDHSEVEITPQDGWMRWQGKTGSDSEAYEVFMPGTERVFPIALHEAFVFRQPGHYEARVTSHLGKRDESHPNANPRGQVAQVTTNAIAFDLAPMPAEVEAARIPGLLDEINTSAKQGAPSLEGGEHDAYARLGTLQGDDALRAKIRLLQADGMYDTAQNFASTRDLKLQLALLQDAWNDVRQPLDTFEYVEEALTLTRRLLRGKPLPNTYSVYQPPDEEARLTASEQRADMEALLRSLPARHGAIRTAAAAYLIRNLPEKLRPLPASLTKAELIARFPSMSELEQHAFLWNGWDDSSATSKPWGWDRIRDPAMVPVMSAMLAAEPQDYDALSRLIDLDPKSAKPYVVHAICDADSYVPLDAVGNLPVASLPEVDGCLADLLRKPLVPVSPDQYLWEKRAMLAARFGSPAIVAGIRDNLPGPAQGATLAMLLRYDPAAAMAQVTADPAKAFFCSQSDDVEEVFSGLHQRLPPAFEAWLQGIADHDTDKFGFWAKETLSKEKQWVAEAAKPGER